MRRKLSLRQAQELTDNLTEVFGSRTSFVSFASGLDRVFEIWLHQSTSSALTFHCVGKRRFGSMSNRWRAHTYLPTILKSVSFARSNCSGSWRSQAKYSSAAFRNSALVGSSCPQRNRCTKTLSTSALGQSRRVRAIRGYYCGGWVCGNEIRFTPCVASLDEALQTRDENPASKGSEALLSCLRSPGEM